MLVDNLTEIVHFFPCNKEITAAECARLFANHVFRPHGMLEVTVSVRSLRFVSKMWEEMLSRVARDLRFNTIIYPEIHQ